MMNHLKLNKSFYIFFILISRPFARWPGSLPVSSRLPIPEGTMTRSFCPYVVEATGSLRDLPCAVSSVRAPGAVSPGCAAALPVSDLRSRGWLGRCTGFAGMVAGWIRDGPRPVRTDRPIVRRVVPRRAGYGCGLSVGSRPRRTIEPVLKVG